MLIVISGVLLLLAARPFAQWAAESTEGHADTAVAVRASATWLWGYRVAGALVVLIGVTAGSVPIGS